MGPQDEGSQAMKRSAKGQLIHAGALDARGSIGATAVRVARHETAEERRTELDTEGRVIGERRGHRVGALGRYYARGEITSRQHDAGQRFVDEWESANRTARTVADLEAVHGGEVDHAVSMHRIAAIRIDARRKHDEAVRALGPCYPLVADVLLAHGDAAAWARRRGIHEKAGFGILVVSLDALAEHYAIS